MKRQQFLARQANRTLALKLDLERPFITELKLYFNSCTNKIKSGNTDFGTTKEIIRKQQRRITDVLLHNKKKGVDFVRIINDLATCNEDRIKRSANFIDSTTKNKYLLSMDIAKEQIKKDGLLNPSHLLISKVAAGIFKNYIPGRVKDIAITETSSLLESSRRQIIKDVQPTLSTAIYDQDIDLLDDIYELTDSWEVYNILNQIEESSESGLTDEERRRAFTSFHGQKKIWMTMGDDRVRLEHEDADGQEQLIDDPFEVGGELLMCPGDTSLGASIWNIANCRCSAGY